MDKTTILSKIAEMLQEHIRQIEASVVRYKLASDLDDNDIFDPEDFSRQAEASEMHHRFKQLLVQAKEQEFFIIDHDEECHARIEPGALIETEVHFIYIGIAIPSFQLEGKTVLTISEKAPAFENLRGKKAGDTLELGEKHYKILSVT